MFKREKERHFLMLFVAALAVVVVAFVLLVLPYAVTEAYGLKATKLILLMRLVMCVFLAGLLIFWVVRYRRTSRDLGMLREELEQNRLSREKPTTPCMREANQKERNKQK